MMEEPHSPIPAAADETHCGVVMDESSSSEEEERENQKAHDTNAATKSQTFRKRRLTYTKHHLGPMAAEALAQNDDEEEEKENEALKKPRLHLNIKTTDQKEEGTQLLETPRPTLQRLPSIILHSGELKRNNSSSSSLHRTPHRVEKIQTEDERQLIPAWRHRHVVVFDGGEEEQRLPFPRTVVGTYSCHGVEPVYDSDYNDEEDDNDEVWSMEDEKKEEEVTSPTDTEVSPEPTKPSTVAKINQDRGGIAFPYGNSNRTALFAAYDGHGQGGEFVSQFALHEVQHRLEQHPDFESNIEKAFKETFMAVDEDLVKEPSIEPMYAGTTACVVLLRDNVLTIANAGDSRAVLARRVQGYDEFETIDLSHDHNPDVPEEQQRIEENGGFVSPPPEPGLSARVWLDPDFNQIGLAMARSIGDHAVTPVGVIAEPEVTTHEVTEDDDFFIIATDGVWEFLSSEEAVRIVAEHLHEGATAACQALIEEAAAKWHEEEGNYRDDITALVVRLQKLWDNDNDHDDDE